MKKRKIIWLPKLLAGCLLALFLFIQVVKALHHHDIKQTFAKEIPSGKHVEAKTECAICDYYFAKDANAKTASIQLESPVILSPFYTDCLSKKLTSIGLSSTDRGPPSYI